MSKLFTPDDIRKYFYASCILALICLLFAFISICDSGLADFFMKGSTTGNGYSYSSLDGKDKYGLTRLNGTGIEQTYDMTETITEIGDSILTYSNVVYIQDARGKGQRFVFKDSGAGVGAEIYVSDMVGEFSAEGDSNLTVYEDGTVFYDNTFTIAGNMTFHGRLIDSRTGKPANEEQLEGVGQFVVSRQIQVMTIMDYNDWLTFCSSFSDNIPDSVGVKLVPENSTEVIG